MSQARFTTTNLGHIAVASFTGDFPYSRISGAPSPEIGIDGLPVGFIVTVVGSNAIPAGTLECNGAYISKTTYAALWTGNPLSIGWTYGQTATTFKLPDFRGMFLRGWDHGRGLDPDSAGRPGAFPGDNVGTSQNDEFRSHVHNMNKTNVLTTPDNGHGGAGDHMTPITLGNTLPTGGNETRPYNMYVLHCIKY